MSTETEIKTASELDIENPEPGIYEGVPDSTYFQVKAVNNSRINQIIESPAKAKYEVENPDYSSTDSQLLGSVAHLLLLQPEQKERLKMLPEGYAGSNDWKEELISRFPDAPLSTDNKKAENLELIEEHYPDTVIADEATKELAEQMIEKMKADDKRYYKGKLEKIMSSGYAEVVFIWEDEETGIVCKCKFDWINFEIGLGFDYKTTKDANPQKFNYSVSDYGYHRQLAFYYRGAIANDVELKKNAILAQEKEQPLLHAWFEFMFDADYVRGSKGNEFMIANYQIDGALKRWKYCIENDYWPGYTNGFQGDNIFPIALKWDDYKRYENDPFIEDEQEIELKRVPV